MKNIIRLLPFFLLMSLPAVAQQTVSTNVPPPVAIKTTNAPAITATTNTVQGAASNTPAKMQQQLQQDPPPVYGVIFH